MPDQDNIIQLHNIQKYYEVDKQQQLIIKGIDLNILLSNFVRELEELVIKIDKFL